MVLWQDIRPDVRAAGIEELFAGISSLPVNNKWRACRRITEFIIKSGQEATIIITESAERSLSAAVQSSKEEAGGLLLGRAYSLPYTPSHGYNLITFITDAIPSLKYDNSAVSLRMDAEIWTRTREHLDQGKTVIGWYHSHPNLGAFFSDRDRLTQKAFFNNGYSLGVVIDPFRNETKCYMGANSIEISIRFETVPDELASFFCVGYSGSVT